MKLTDAMVSQYQQDEFGVEVFTGVDDTPPTYKLTYDPHYIDCPMDDNPDWSRNAFPNQTIGHLTLKELKKLLSVVEEAIGDVAIPEPTTGVYGEIEARKRQLPPSGNMSFGERVSGVLGALYVALVTSSREAYIHAAAMLVAAIESEGR